MDHTWGKLVLPLVDTNATDFSSLDPARDVLLNLLAAALVAELTPRWADAVAGTALAAATPVQQKLPFEAEPELMTQVGIKFPLLCVSRDFEPQRVDELTLQQDRITSRWGVDYFLGPLDAGRRGKLMDVLQAVGKIIATVVREGGHVAYATTTTPSGKIHRKYVFGSECGFSTIAVTDFRCGPAQFTEKGPLYWACTTTLETTELETGTATYTNFVGTTGTLGTGIQGAIDTDLIVAYTDEDYVPPP